MKAFMVRTLQGLATVDDDRVFRGVRIGAMVEVQVIRRRSIQHHRLYWALVSRIADALDMEPENVSDVLKIKTGHYTTVMTKEGPLKFPRSISFAAMPQDAFRVFFEKCCQIICFEWLPHMTAAQLRREVLQMMGIDWKEGDDERQERAASDVGAGGRAVTAQLEKSGASRQALAQKARHAVS